MPNNVFQLLDNYRSLGTMGIPTSTIGVTIPSVRYPESLSETGVSIPFTLFMPYKRPTGLAGLRAIQTNEDLYTSIPEPEFYIALPTPTSALKTTYSAQYSDVELGQGMGIAAKALGLNAGSTLNDFIETGKKLGGSALVGGVLGGLIAGKKGTVMGAILGAGSEVGKNPDVLKAAGISLMQLGLGALGSDQGIANILVGKADNTFTDQAFKNVQFRSHDFNYVFMPKTDKDSEKIDEIISIFKFAMLPRPALTGFFEFPYEFQIVHSIQNTTFTLLPSVLETFDVDFGGGTDSLKLFKEKNGKQYPTRIAIAMRFKEMVLLNRDRVEHIQTLSSDESAAGSSKKRYRF